MSVEMTKLMAYRQAVLLEATIQCRRDEAQEQYTTARETLHAVDLALHDARIKRESAERELREALIG